MEDEVGRVIAELSSVGDHIIIPTGVESELQVIKDTQEKLANTEMTTRDGGTRIKLEGNFPGCAGAVNLQVCLMYMLIIEQNKRPVYQKCSTIQHKHLGIKIVGVKTGTYKVKQPW